MEQSSAKEIVILEKMFGALNEDGSGKISQEEVKAILNDKILAMKDYEIASVMQEINAEGGRSIDIMNFLIMVSNQQDKEVIHQAIIRRASMKRAMKKAFFELDLNKDGYITRSEFWMAVRKRKLAKLSEKQLDNVVEDADLNSDGKIDYDEFVLMMTI